MRPPECWGTEMMVSCGNDRIRTVSMTLSLVVRRVMRRRGGLREGRKGEQPGQKILATERILIHEWAD